MHELLKDATAPGRKAGNELSLNTVLRGQLIASATRPLPREAVETTIRQKTKAAVVDANSKALALGAEAVAALG